MKYFPVIFFLFLSASGATAQVTTGQLLASAWGDYELQLHREQQAYIESTSFKLPFLRRLEVRTETRDLDPKQQEYALRLSTNGLGMMKTQRAMYGSMKELTSAGQAMLLQEALAERYQLLLEAHFNRRLHGLLEQHRLVLLDKKSVYGQQLSLGLNDDLDDFFRTEDDLLQLERNIFENETDRQAHRLWLKIFTGQEDSLAVGGELISLAQIRQLAETIVQNGPPESPSIVQREVEAGLAVQEEEMERMEGRNLLNYMQFRYTGNANDLLEDRFAIGAGINLPWPNSSKLREQERHVETLEANAELAVERRDHEADILLKTNQLLQFFNRLDLFQNQSDTLKSRYRPEQLHAAGLENPETLLRVQESLVRLEMEVAKLEKEIYQTYLDLLNETGLLVAEPVRNYLSAGLEVIEH